MPRLTKIYTKTGDAGETALGDRTRVAKSSPRVEAYGEVDEANSGLGLVIAAAPEAGPRAFLPGALRAIQQDLFDLGADLCAPIGAEEKPGDRLRVTADQVAWLERLIDEHNAHLPALDSFILPGGTELAARLHLARAITRRAERRVAALMAVESGTTNPITLVYLNRLSDLLFVLARAANTDGAGDILWIPGARRDGPSAPAGGTGVSPV